MPKIRLENRLLALASAIRPSKNSTSAAKAGTHADDTGGAAGSPSQRFHGLPGPSVGAPLRRQTPSPARLAVLAVALALTAASPAHAHEANRMAAMDIQGGVTIDVKPGASGGPALVSIRLPKAVGDLQCRRPGFRPQQLIYGAAPLDHAVQLGRAVQAQWKPDDDAKASIVHTFAAFVADERGGPKQRKLLDLETAARGLCAQGKGGALPPITLAMAGRCSRVKGLGDEVGMVGASRPIPVEVRCATPPPPAQPTTPGPSANRRGN